MDFTDIINLFPSMSALAREMKVPYVNVKRWRQRNFIPCEHWFSLIKAARKWELPFITAEVLVMLARIR